MNIKPHTHEVKIETHYDDILFVHKVIYGQTGILVARGPFLARRIKHAIHKAVVKHDRGSRKEARKEARRRRTDIQGLARSANESLLETKEEVGESFNYRTGRYEPSPRTKRIERDDAWGRDLLKTGNNAR